MRYFLLCCVAALLSSCGGSSPTKSTEQSDPPQTAETKSPQPSPAPEKTSDEKTKRRDFKPIALGGNEPKGSQTDQQGTSEQPSIESVFAALKPLNILMGEWNTTTRNSGAGEATWIVDAKTAKTQPTLTMATDKHPYFKEAHLTFLPAKQVFQMTAVDREGAKRVYEGKYEEKPKLVPGDNNKLQRQYKLKLLEVGNEDARKLVGVMLNQQENNRMLMVVYRRVGKRVQVADTVANQRKNTSFALSDVDYGNRECIVSQGLGTTAVMYNGKTYYVCCSGCQAAFQDDPEIWIAKAAERKRAKAEPE